MKIHLFTFFLFIASLSFYGQEYFPKNDGVKTEINSYKAFTNATIYVSPTQVIKNGTLLIQNGFIKGVGNNITIPENTSIYDMKGASIYPSFIDLYSKFGIKKSFGKVGGGRSVQYKRSREGYYWNDHILSDYNSLTDYHYNGKEAKKMRSIGFGTVNTHRPEGIYRGTGFLVTLNDNDKDGKRILSQKSSQNLSFKKSKFSNQSYPTSTMGAMALLRQFYYDADWYVKNKPANKDLAIESYLENKKLPIIFDASDKLNVLRAAKIAKEFNLNYIIKGEGKEFEHLKEIKKLRPQLILPLNFPEAYDVADVLFANNVTLNQMRYWNQAASNPSILANTGISFAFTSYGLKSEKDFFKNIQKAIDRGLNEKKALEALTTFPAKILGVSNKLGTLQKGKIANFIITSGPIFDTKTKIYENWVQGKLHIIKDRLLVDIDGEYSIAIKNREYTLKVSNSTDKIKTEIVRDSTKLKTKSTYKNNWLYLTLFEKDSTSNSIAQLVSKINNRKKISGTGTNFNGDSFDWKANRIKDIEVENNKSKKEEKKEEVVAVTYPNNGYGFSKLPTSETILFKNATVWTNEEEGILKNTDVLIKNGKIAAIGKDLTDNNNTKIIDATGKHLTSGIIDEHSHIAATSINEAGHNSSAEVKIEDVIDPDDINIYRNLAGGVTTIQILHGSANPIGGQSAIIKLKWGHPINELLYPNADKFIKFALGENVKQSNWQSFSRFPQTRMGVEQVFIDYFQRAKEYRKKWKDYNRLSSREKRSVKVPRYDLEMEALAEILEKKRFISCHSYVQSEINMLMKVADRFGFNVNTFTHILEGYKLADKMKAHGAGGSTFSDWWAYKYEVNDAIPYNGAIMHNVGVVTAFNSDDAEMSRRLNQEAAKAIKYGGVSEIDAWKFITLNPAKLLHIDDKVGSIKVGKSADLVLWSNHPMSIYTQAEKTLIDGAIYFDKERNEKQLKKIKKERKILTQQMLEVKKSGGKTQKSNPKTKIEMHCETIN